MKQGAIWTDQYAVHSPDDSNLWLDLVMYASIMDDELAAILIYLRNAGTKLVQNEKYGYRLVPVVNETGWESAAQYKEETKYLKPFQKQLEYCLRKLK